jgi:hypothetical protein
MARNEKRRMHYPRCRRCRLERLPEETFYRGLCPACMDVDKRKRHAATGARLLAKAKDAGTVERDGQTFTVVVLTPKRRGGRRIR